MGIISPLIFIAGCLTAYSIFNVPDIVMLGLMVATIWWIGFIVINKRSNMNKQKIYISGKISGLPYDVAVAKFAEAEEQLTKKGYEVLNPINNGLPKDAMYQDHMLADLDMLLHADLCYMQTCVTC